MRDRRRSILARAAAVGLACGLAWTPPVARATDARTPNIVIILADDLGYSEPSIYYPDTVSPTPNLDRLAEQGIRFMDAHSPSSVCSPTRYALLTGRYAWRTRLKHGVLSTFSEPLIERDRVTLPEILKSCGYRTAAIGKWHLGLNVPELNGDGFVRPDDPEKALAKVDFSAPMQDGPLDHGFDTYFGAQLRGVRRYVRDRHFVEVPEAEEEWSFQQRGPRYLAAALEFLDECQLQDPERPFFLYFGSESPHAPYAPADSLAGVAIAGTSPAGPRADAIKELDVTIGALVGRIDELGLARNTLVIVTSDNGPPKSAMIHRGAAPHGLRGSKGGVQEASHRVPLVARWGDGTAAGSTIAPGSESFELVGLQDIVATVSEVVGVPLGPDSAEDSQSFYGALLQETPERPTRTDVIVHGAHGEFGIRTADWKFVVDFDSVAVGPDATAPLPVTGQLFDLRSDPAESVDKSGDHPDLSRSLAETLNRQRREGRSVRADRKSH
ncbi:MAG: arylsulfatase [Gemmatimonadota bacterium]|nr:MAG: arylsulfatase [Gemmatimonadota bacterium]